MSKMIGHSDIYSPEFIKIPVTQITHELYMDLNCRHKKGLTFL